MKMIFGVVAVVAAMVATIGATSATLPDFSPEILSKLHLTDPNVKESEAELVNPDAKVDFKDFISSDVDGITLFTIPNPDEGQNDGICGSKIGIQIKNGPTACNVENFRLKLQKKHGITYGSLVMFLNSENTKPFLITTPLFTVPAEYASTDKEQTWANDNRVGLVSPVDSKKLKSILDNESIGVDFKWLNELMRFGLTLRGSDALLDSFVSRPIAVTQAVADEFVKVIETKKSKEDSAEFLSAESDSLYVSAESEFIE